LQIEQKQKYAIWKAADIRKAIKEGRRPEPGPPGGDQDLSGPVDSSWEGNVCIFKLMLFYKILWIWQTSNIIWSIQTRKIKEEDLMPPAFPNAKYL
jgi:hypothetical protein